MLNYEETKLKAVDTLTHGAYAIAVTHDHDGVRKLANSLIEACRLLLWLEDLQEAKEKGDLKSMIEAKAKNGF